MTRFGHASCVRSAILGAAVAVLSPAVRAEDARIDYSRDIRPILSNNCYKCHGPDEAERKGKLRLDTKQGAFEPRASAPAAIVAASSDKSLLYQRISHADPAQRMPPPASGKILTPPQIELIKRWIDQGAEWRDHWSFIPPTRPPLPHVQNVQAVLNPIDRLVIARLEREGLKPSPPADKTTLIRRLTLDLTGLPPTPAEVDAFLADDSPIACETLIDRLLRSPRYGEHMARYWLDAARYGDTHGLHLDNERSLWPYRDWVIKAFNRNMPFDQFTIEQLAGDLLPNPTREQQVATGFNRCNVSTSEGGSIDEEVLVRYAVDRVETTSTVWMGLTLGCAVCHDHKFDPVTQKEFYQLYAFFGSTQDKAMDGNSISPPPIMKLPTADQGERLKLLDEQLALGRRNIADVLGKVRYEDPGAAAPTKLLEPAEYVWIDDELPPGARPQGNTEWKFVSKAEGPVFCGEKASTRTAAGLSQHYFTEASPGLAIGDGDKLFAYVLLDANNPPQTIMLQFNDGTWEHRAFWGADTIPWGAAGSPAHVAMGLLPEKGQWVRLEVDAAKVGLAPGSILNGWAFTQHDGTVFWDKAGIVTRTPQAGQGFESQAAWEAYERTRSKSNVPQPVRDAVKVEPEKRNDEQKKLVRDYFVEHVCVQTRPLFDGLHAQVDRLNKERADIESRVPTTMVMADMTERRDTHVLIRGAYNKKGDKVETGLPAVLPPMPGGAPMNRLGLAQWLVQPSHPLTARVIVNRLWQQLFGRGIVKTAEDFGSQGEWPSHPELLDWLAAEFVDSGWNVKHMLKLIVTSGTYQQSSRVTPELAERDPENVLLARGPRFRMDAEVVRDSALAVSGLLVERVGGRSVKPYQPPGLWEAVGFVGSTTREFKRDAGDALYRRSLYTFWKRTCPPPSMLTFDAPSRETCTVRRARTNTPLQALALMNDEQYVEASRQFARRMMTEGGSQPFDRLSYGFRLVTARRPEPKELDVLGKVYEDQLAFYRSDKDAATKLLTVGESPRDESLDPSEHAAWTMVANLLLNLDETIAKE